MWFTFQQSKIFEAGNPVDPHGHRVRIKAKSEERARGRLGSPGSGRSWVLIDPKPE